MPNTPTTKFAGLLVLILGLSLLPTHTLRSKPLEKTSQDSPARRRQALERRLAQHTKQQELDRKIANFKRTKDLLQKKGVPFDPDILLTPNWRKTLAPNFDQMREMQEVKIGPGKVKGVQLAHTLYLPEKVELTGDTVILVRNLVFEGRNAIIRGTFSMSVYPIEQTGLLGSTLDQALQPNGVRFMNASFAVSNRQKLIGLPLINEGTLTIDTHGLGYKDWLERQARVRGQKGPFVQASFSQTIEINHNGAPGAPGADALPGADGAAASGVASRGADGTCGSTTSATGKIGGKGPNGNAGNRPTSNGGRGGDGGHASPITLDIPDQSNFNISYVLKAMGGDGGPGGSGGRGGRGSDGLRGGQGGTGANCPCNQGGVGPGGPGGPGGDAGAGGPGSNGGQGGNGGDGKSITVTYPAFYNPSKIQPFYGGGWRGNGGSQGVPGLSGNPGDGGFGGMSGGVIMPKCLNPSWGGETGNKGQTANQGAWGEEGASGDRDGASVTPSINPRISRGCRVAPVCDFPFHSDFDQCCCADNYGNCVESPIIVDVVGNGYRLTSAAEGVNFDLNADGAAERLSWTEPGSDDAFLFLDFNQNGMIDSGAELFGNFTPQPPSSSPNGFIALAEFDKTENGGNADGIIDSRDAVYARLRLWQDTNHNGSSDAGELLDLVQSGVNAISLDYERANRRDQFGNMFFYRSKIEISKRSSSVQHWTYDVFLVPSP